MHRTFDTNATQFVDGRRGTQLAGLRHPGLGRFRHLSKFKIGPRLVFCFLVILALMLAGDGLLLWQFHRVHVQGSRLTAAGEELIAISRFQTDFFRLNARLDELAKSTDIEGLKKEAEPLREALLGDIDRTRNVISHSPAELHPDPTILPTLEAIQSTLPSQLEKLIALAEASDWEAVRLRISNEKKPLETEVSALVQAVEQHVSAELAAQLMESARVRRRILVIVPSTAIFTLLVATFLGLVITRSITRPLARLVAGSKALSKGDFSHRIRAEGDDELASLGEVFDDMIVRLQELYGDVRRSEARWRSVFENSAVGVALTDLNGRFIATNDAYQKMLDYREEELKSLSLLDVTEEEHLQPTRALIGELLEGKRQQFQIEKPNRRKNGSLVWVRKNVSVVSGSDEVPRFLMALSEDVTERKRAEEALQRSERDLAAIINTIPTAAWTTRPDGYCDFINQVWLNYAGMTAEKAQGRGWAEAIHPDDRNKLIEDWQSCLASGI